MVQENSGLAKKASLALTVIVIVITIAVAWGSVLTTVQKIDSQVAQLDKRKVDKEVYDECVRGLRSDIGDIKAEQQRTNMKLDRIIEKL